MTDLPCALSCSDYHGQFDYKDYPKVRSERSEYMLRRVRLPIHEACQLEFASARNPSC